MRHIERTWLRRIGGYLEQTPRGRLRPGDDGAWGEDALGDAPVEGEADGDESAAMAPDSEPGAGEPQDDDEAPPSLPEHFDDRLSIPDEVAQAHEEEQRRQSAQNRNLAPRAFELKGHYLRNLATRFARMISKVAEDAADFPTQGDDEWDLPELLQRRFTGRHINQCRMTREKRKVVVVLDTSPSCLHQAMLFRNLATIADELGDCELYDAPNFALNQRKVGDLWEPVRATDHEWHFEGRVVLAFGDFDGIERIGRASQRARNKIYWFCCEERPFVLESNRDYFVHNFRGHYFVTPTLNKLMHAMKRVR
jgi:hypothetical protein